MGKPNVYISVWYDETSDDEAWVVDQCDEDDNSETVRCFSTESEAKEFAREHREKTGLPIR